MTAQRSDLAVRLPFSGMSALDAEQKHRFEIGASGFAPQQSSGIESRNANSERNPASQALHPPKDMPHHDAIYDEMRCSPSFAEAIA